MCKPIGSAVVLAEPLILAQHSRVVTYSKKTPTKEGSEKEEKEMRKE
jgi:hypothetical protein